MAARCNTINYFVAVLAAFAIMTLYLNRLSMHQEATGATQLHLQSFFGEEPPQIDTDVTERKSSPLAGLSCDRFGGPPDEQAQQMVYWQDIPEDNRHVSPFYKQNQFLTFEPDAGGWNNIRMAMETVLALAFAMGRTLVLPPEKEFYLLGQKHHKGQKQRKHFSFEHFFHMDAIHEEHEGLDIISMKEFLETQAMTGNLVSVATGIKSFPPGNRTAWDGASKEDVLKLFEWLRGVAHVAQWDPESCLAAFPAQRDNDVSLRDLETQMIQMRPNWENYIDHPVPVDGSAAERLAENWAQREGLCIYDTSMQHSPLVHFAGNRKDGARLLVHFYAFLFFEDWKQDLWMKRFIRDHVRYTDEIQCAAARVVTAVRQRSVAKGGKGEFDSFHIRRGDFQYKKTRVSAEEILKQAQKKVPNGSTVYIGTDERDKSFFAPLAKFYDVVFLDDFLQEIPGTNSNYFGMIDQLVASQGRLFFGCWFSTFSSYVMRIRGYHTDRQKLPGYERGVTNSWYYVLPDRFDHMQHYYPVKKVFYAREFPTSWRLINQHTGVP